jgi:hypothetical protein
VIADIFHGPPVYILLPRLVFVRTENTTNRAVRCAAIAGLPIVIAVLAMHTLKLRPHTALERRSRNIGDLGFGGLDHGQINTADLEFVVGPAHV